MKGMSCILLQDVVVICYYLESCPKIYMLKITRLIISARRLSLAPYTLGALSARHEVQLC